jgi:DNA-binding MarR family transcriptional regulator
MATTTTEVPVPAEIIEPLELLMFGAIGMTTLALSAASAGELTISQWRVLVVLGRVDAARVGELAAAVGVSLPSTSRLVRRLERRGLVTTERDTEDRRATLVRMTPEGRDIRDEVINRRRAMMEAAIAARAPRLPAGLAAGLTAIALAFDAYE